MNIVRFLAYPVLGLSLLAGTGLAQPDPQNCSATRNALPTTVSVYNRPDGQGNALTAARVYPSGTLNATVTVYLLDSLGDPVVGYPAANVRLGAVGSSGTFATCVRGASADGPSDSLGRCFFSGTLEAGGYTVGGNVYAFVDDVPLTGYPLNIRFNSADISGDLVVDTTDQTLFQGDLMGPYNYRSDFDWSGLVNMVDAAIFASANGAECNVTGLVEIDVTPDGIGAAWTLSGPGGFLETGSEDETFGGLDAGTYTLTWDDLACWTTPSPNPDVQELPPAGSLAFAGTYEPYGTVFIDPDPDGVVPIQWKLYGSAPFDTLYGTGDYYTCLPPDNYTLIWRPVAGWYHDCPNPDTRLLGPDEFVTFGCLYHEYGSIVVDPEPDQIDAPWTLQGSGGYTYAGHGDQTVADLRPGSYTLTWADVPGWYLPCGNPMTVSLGEGDIASVNCTYRERGAVVVDAEPNAINAAWRLTGPLGFDTTQSGDQTLTLMVPGDYQLTWLPEPCWTRPDPNPVEIELPDGGLITFAGTYLQNGTITIAAEPDLIDAPWRLTGPASYDTTGTGDAVLTCRTPGAYAMQWLPVPGWILSCPDPEPQILPPGGAIGFACTYGEAGTVMIDPDPDSLSAPWHLIGPAAFDTTGTGDATLLLRPAGAYTLTWGDLPYWVEPWPNPDGQVLAPEGTITFAGTYAPLPEITGIADVGNDQGRRVRILWRRCLFDAPNDGVEVTAYGIYRRQDDYKGPQPPAGEYLRDPDTAKMLGWDVLGMVPARQDSMYQYVAETLCDSTESDGVCWSVFMISAVTVNPGVFFDSRPDSGYSLDNLAPSVPQGLLVDYGATSTRLAWDPGSEDDLRYYRVYRAALAGGESGGCGPRPEVPAAQVPVSDWTDIEGGWGSCYYVTAVDFAGNESPPTLWSAAGVTGAPDGDLPTRFALHPNVPNPFNPVTTISYDLPRTSPVQLVIYDANGCRVRILIAEVQQAPGRHHVDWNGRDQQGAEVAAGVYFCRLEAGGETATVKMLFLK